MENLIDEFVNVRELNCMTLSKLLEGITVTKMVEERYGQMLMTNDLEVHSVQYDSRKVQQNDMFVAIRGTSSDGNRFIQDAVGRGAIVVITDNDVATPDSLFMHSSVVKIVVPDARIALARLASTYFDNPSRRLTMVGVTGTNGKTTTTHLVKSLLEANGKLTGLLGTIEYVIGDRRIPATHTTPESLELNHLLAQMVEAGCTAAVMEISSHALHQHRVDGIGFDLAVFTNLTQDHLDYHGSIEEYFKAKKILFDHLSSDATAIINTDDEWGRKIYESVPGRKISYGIVSSAEVRARDLSLAFSGTNFTIECDREHVEIQLPMVGKFNVYNTLAAFAAGRTLGIASHTMQRALHTLPRVPGRFEQIESPDGWTAIIDYAHTPDALLNALTAVRSILGANGHGRVITVFGCGGNRDSQKRPIMGRIASEQSDITIVTSDNPRHENPETIIDEVMAGIIKGAPVYRQADRKKAIGMALDLARSGDAVLIAGKGHEDYQVVGDRKIHFSDREIVGESLCAHP